MAGDLVEQLVDRAFGISTPMMEGDNLAIVLCNNFENVDQEEDGDTGWTPDATAGYEQVRAALQEHFQPAADRIAALEAALRCSPIPALREEMMAFRDRQDKWLRDTYTPVMTRTAMNPDIVEVVARATKDYGLHCQRLRDGREVWRVMDGHSVTIGGDHKTLGLALEAYRLAVVAETLTAARPAIMDEAAGIAEAHKEAQPTDDQWWKGWNAACDHLAGLFRELDEASPMATAIRAAVKP